MALLALSRVDHVLFAFFIFAAMLFQSRHDLKGFIHNGFRVGAPILAVFGGYLCMNKLLFGTFLPISGIVKAFYEAGWLRNGWPNGGFWGNIDFHIRYVLDLALGVQVNIVDGFLYRRFNIVLPLHVQLDAMKHALYGILIIGILFGFYKVWKRELTPYYAALAAFAIFHLLLYAVRLPHFTLYGTWYFTVEFLFILLAFFFGLEACCRLPAFAARSVKLPRLMQAAGPRLYPAFAAGFCAAAFLVTFTEARRFAAVDANSNAFRRAALWINENLPEQTTIGAHSAGILAYFVEGRAVVNLDGLINSASYLKVMQEGRFADYALANLDYYADYSTAELEQTGICWAGGCVPPEKLSLEAKWPINGSANYYILKLRP